jgi:hypothetical protein
MGEKNKKPTFTEAVQAIVESHTRLYALLMEVLPSYRGEAEMPPREKRISRILDCETNDAHRLLENLATAAKAVPRGSLGAEPDILIAECRSFLEFLESNLPCPECAAAINDTCQIEEAFVNFIKGISGGDPGMTRRQYSRRIDKFVRDIKTSFRTLGRAIVKLECRQMQFRFLQKAELGCEEDNPDKKTAKNNYDKSHSEEWTQNDAAELLGISTRQLRRYKTNPPKDWPGWEDPILLKKWKIKRDDRNEMAHALKMSVPYREGITEKRMKATS